jgi:hypothetical protein
MAVARPGRGVAIRAGGVGLLVELGQECLVDHRIIDHRIIDHRIVDCWHGDDNDRGCGNLHGLHLWILEGDVSCDVLGLLLDHSP